MRKTRFKRFLALAIVLALVLPTTALTYGTNFVAKDKPANTASNNLNKNDKTIVNDISNMTGLTSEEIIKLKNEGNSWNEILKTLKGNNPSDEASDKRINFLLEDNLDKEFIQKLRDEGFSNGEIIEAKSLVERVIFQLKEITNNRDLNPELINSDNNQNDVDKQDIELYQELLNEIDPQTAIYLTLKLEKDFGSYEKALDEYLLSIQIGTDLNQYLTDKKSYEKEKSEKAGKVDIEKIITLQRIEEKVLEIIQDQNDQMTKEEASSLENFTPNNIIDDQSKASNDIPISPLPDVGNPKPENPQEDILKELDDLKNMSLGIGGENNYE